MTPGAVVVAAGLGQRLGAARPKALLELAGRPLVQRAVDGLRHGGIDRIVVAHPEGFEDAFTPLVGGARLVVGGATRTASVRAGLAALPADAEVVAVHDAARGLTPPAVIAAALAAVGGEVVAAAPARPMADTLKRVATDGSRQVLGTVSRDEVAAVQTPQVFLRGVLEQALAAGGEASDDLALVEALLAAGTLSGRVVLVEGSALGMKVTWPEDVVVAEALLETSR